MLLIESAEGEVRFGREGVERRVVVDRCRESVRKGALNVDPDPKPDCDERWRTWRVVVDVRASGGEVDKLELRGSSEEAVGIGECVLEFNPFDELPRLKRLNPRKTDLRFEVTLFAFVDVREAVVKPDEFSLEDNRDEGSGELERPGGF